MRCRLVSLLDDLCHDLRGATLLIFTVALFTLMLVVAVAIDLGRGLLIKQRLISAADAAALAVGAEPELTPEEATSKAEAFIRAHYPDTDFGDLHAFAVVAGAEQVDVTVTARVPTTFLKVARIDTFDVSVTSRALRQQRDLEVALVLDNTGSMQAEMCEPVCETKLARLKSAAHKLVDILFADGAVSEHVKIALVPFSGAVNIGTDKLGSGWLDEAGVSPLQDEDIDLPPDESLLGLFADMTNAGWGGCVRARVGASGYDLTDEPPGAGNPESLWVPYFAPDEPGTGNGPPPPVATYYNDYINDTGLPGSNAQKQRNAAKYMGATVSAANLAHDPPLGPNFNCVPQRVQPLTSVKSVITTAIDGMAAAGSTVIPEGLAWGWRVLSPTAPYTEGVPYTNQQTIKAIILLTDGRNQVEGNIGHNHSFYSAYGYAASGHLGNTSGSETRAVLDAKTAALCNTIKADKDGLATDNDVYVYTLTFQVPDAATRTMMQTCATPPADCPGNQCYFDSPAAADLENAFERIAIGLSELRLAR